jgi:hypothetical protein
MNVGKVYDLDKKLVISCIACLGVTLSDWEASKRYKIDR